MKRAAHPGMTFEPREFSGRTWEPVYTVDDWGHVWFFVGHDYRYSSAFTHGHREQTDLCLDGPFTADVLVGDTVYPAVRVKTRERTTTVGDMGHDYVAEWTDFEVALPACPHCGRTGKVNLSECWIDPATIRKVKQTTRKETP